MCLTMKSFDKKARRLLRLLRARKAPVTAYKVLVRNKENGVIQSPFYFMDYPTTPGAKIENQQRSSPRRRAYRFPVRPYPGVVVEDGLHFFLHQKEAEAVATRYDIDRAWKGKHLVAAVRINPKEIIGVSTTDQWASINGLVTLVADRCEMVACPAPPLAAPAKTTKRRRAVRRRRTNK